MKQILQLAPQYYQKLWKIKDSLLADLVLVGEIPSPTFEESCRREWILERFVEGEMEKCSSDEAGNAVGIIPGKKSDRTVLLMAHMDTNFPARIDHAVTIEKDHVMGTGLADNSLGLAVLTMLPRLLQHLGISLNLTLVLLASARSLGKGNLEGAQFFLKHSTVPVDYALCVEGYRIGRLSYSSIGMLRGEITYRLPESYDWTRFDTGGAIVSMNEVINAILEIPCPGRPRTSVVFNLLESSASFNLIPTTARLQLEVRSDSQDMVRSIYTRIQDICAEVASSRGAEVQFQELAWREPGGLRFSHPLASSARNIISSLDIVPRITPSTSELAACIAANIPAVTIGLTDAENYNKEGERVQIDKIFTGITQLIMLLQAIDKGYCDVA